MTSRKPREGGGGGVTFDARHKLTRLIKMKRVCRRPFDKKDYTRPRLSVIFSKRNLRLSNELPLMLSTEVGVFPYCVAHGATQKNQRFAAHE